jgi:hypothetical protein
MAEAATPVAVPGLMCRLATLSAAVHGRCWSPTIGAIREVGGGCESW